MRATPYPCVCFANGKYDNLEQFIPVLLGHHQELVSQEREPLPLRIHRKDRCLRHILGIAAPCRRLRIGLPITPSK